jgi:large subunit ribosomal protein L18
MKTSPKVTTRKARQRRIRARVSGTTARPRLAIFRSNSAIYAQVIDDTVGKTVAAANDLKTKKGTKSERAAEVGKTVAEAAKAAKIETVVFDRGGYAYTGRVKIVAEAARAAGLKF